MAYRRNDMDRLQARWATLATQFLAVLLCTALARSATTVPRIEVLEGDGAINNIRSHGPAAGPVGDPGDPIPGRIALHRAGAVRHHGAPDRGARRRRGHQ